MRKKANSKRILAVVLSAMLTLQNLGGFPGVVRAESLSTQVAEEGTAETRQSDEETSETRQSDEMESAGDVSGNDEASETSEEDTVVEEGEVPEIYGYNPIEGADAPASYSSIPRRNWSLGGVTVTRKYIPDFSSMPEIRNQNPYGTCWAHSTMALAEMSVRRQTGEILDLSELQLAYFMYHNALDPLGGTEGDSHGYKPSYDKNGNLNSLLDTGGNLEYVAPMMSGWKGIAEDAGELSYSNAENVNSSEDVLDARYAYLSDVVHVRNSYKINIKDNPQQLKEMIMTYGAASISYCESSNFYNATTAAYYCNTNYDTNHAVTIVGWDDDYSYMNFQDGMRPSNNGAWLIRNSWGGSSTSYGHNGYFWMSYEDKSLSSTAFVFDCVSDQHTKTDEYYDNNYQYDGCAASFSRSYSYNDYTDKAIVANVFKVKNAAEELKAVNFGTEAADQSYIVRIYRNPSEGNPTSGELVSTALGHISFAGFYTVELDQTVSLVAGDSFSVVLECTPDRSGSYIQYMAERSIDSWYKGTASAEAGQSYEGSYPNGDIAKAEWTDYGRDNNRNFRIKAYTDTIDDSAIKMTDIILEEGKAELSLYKDESYKISYSYLPENATERKIIWSSSDENIATVTEAGVVKALMVGNATITATLMDGTQKSISIRVKNTATSISLTGVPSAEYVDLGASIALGANIEGDGVTGSDITWSSSDEKVLKVDSNGQVLAVGMGRATITAKIGIVSASCTISVEGVAENVFFAAIDGAKARAYWDGVPNATEYQIYAYQTQSDKSPKVMANISGGEDSYEYDFVADASYPYYSIVTLWKDGVNNFGFVVARQSIKTVSIPRFTAVYNTPAGIHLEWTGFTRISEYPHYALYKATNGSFSFYKKIDGTEYDITGDELSPFNDGQVYRFCIVGMNDSDQITWNDGRSIKSICRVEPMTRDSLSTEVSNTGSVSLHWTRVSGADGYAIYRRDENESFAKPIRMVADVDTYVDRSAGKGKSYFYTVQAMKGIYGGAYDSVGVHVNHSCDFASKNETEHTGTCSVCHQNVTENHQMVEEIVGDAVYKKCKKCGFDKKIECEHQFTETILDEERHRKTCSECHYFVDEAHSLSYTKTDDSFHMEECRCGYSKNSVPHEWGAFTSIDGTNHSKSCKKCYAEIIDAHSLVYTKRDKTNHSVNCSNCNYSVVPEAHDWDNWTNKDSSEHEKYCIKCGEELTGAHHLVASDNADGTHTIRCSDSCGYLIAGQAHKMAYDSKTEEEHIYKCQVCGREERTAHNLQKNDAGNGTHTITCSDENCRFTKNEAHDMQFKEYTDSEHSYQCTICSSINTVAHAIEKSDNNNGTHTIRCTIEDCGYSETEDHNLKYEIVDENNHSVSCKICGYYVPSESHDWGDWTSKSNAEHRKVCKNCGEEFSGEHHLEFLDNENGTHTISCSDACGYQITDQVHSLKITDNRDGTHTIICTDGCGYQIENQEHKFICKKVDGDTHNYQCMGCDYVTEMENHIWDEGRIVNPATYIANGNTLYLCKVDGCDATKKEEILMKEKNSITGYLLELSQTEYVYAGRACTPNVVLKKGNETISSDYYIITYSNNNAPGTATVTVTAKAGNIPYKGSISTTFNILPKPEDTNPSGGEQPGGNQPSGDQPGNNPPADEPSSNVPDTEDVADGDNSDDHIEDEEELVLSSPVITGIENTKDGVLLNWGKVEKANGYLVYRVNGKTRKLLKTISDGNILKYTDKKASNGTLYSYYVVAFSGDVKSVESKTKEIYRLTGVSISSAKNSSAKKVTVKWKKNSKATGYEIKCVQGSSTKKYTITKASTVSKVIGSLKKGKTYSISIRCYKKQSKKATYYSAWSSAKKVKIKK